VYAASLDAASLDAASLAAAQKMGNYETRHPFCFMAYSPHDVHWIAG